LTKTIAIIALTCLLVVAGAVASIVGGDSVPAARVEMLSPKSLIPVANRASKQDKLPVTMPASAIGTAFGPKEPLRQAYASSSAADVEAAAAATSALPASTSALAPISLVPPGFNPPDSIPVAPPKPKAAVKPQLQKAYALLSDAQIAGVKERLRLSSDQEYYWPAVETALRAVVRRIQAARLSNPNASSMPIDPDSDEVQQLKSAAMPLLFQLREDQKDEVRKLARVIGLDKVAAAI
jgi:Arc/MetJ family transcription regulator